MKKIFVKLWEEYIYPWGDCLVWEIAQRAALKNGKHIEATYGEKKGFFFQNPYNKTIWFHPYDNSYLWGNHGSDGIIKALFFEN